MSISPITSSTMSMYVPAPNATGQNNYEYQLIIQELLALGIAPTGNFEQDKNRLEIAKNLQAMQENQSLQKKQTIPFEEIMNTLNIKITGDLDKDYETTIDKLEYEIDMAYTQEDIDYYEGLKYQVEEEYNNAKRNRISYFEGANQLGMLNRYMLGI